MGEPDNTVVEEKNLLVPAAGSVAISKPFWHKLLTPDTVHPPAPTKKRKWAFGILWIIGGSGYLAASALFGWFAWAGLSMPDTSPLWAPKATPVIVILDRHDRVLLKTGGREAKPVVLNELPPALPHALIATEDKRFYSHPGFDVIGLMRAMRENMKQGRIVQGGSTITQQLAKNVFLTRRQTLKRKTQEIMLSVWLEHRLTKLEILETYLSRVYFGGGTIGIESGAQRFFNKPAKDLDIGEAALLAGILQAPDRLNPNKNHRASAERTAQVLIKMRGQNYVSVPEFKAAMTAPILVEPYQVRALTSARYFTDDVLAQTDKIIGVPRGDIVIHTSLDRRAQAAAELAVARGVDTKRNAQQAALIAFDGTGGVRAMVGGASYEHSPFNRAVKARRQPGSAFKPFVYLAALQHGHRPWDIYTDREIDIKGWKPGNFSNKFLGEMSLEKALALSVNTIAVQLGEDVGRDNIVAAADMMGLPGFKPYASLALGAQEVSLYELSAAYVPFANWGKRVTPYSIEAIYGADGYILYERAVPQAQQLLPREVLGQMNLMLKTVTQRGTGKRARIEGRETAGKTGTTNDYRDAWFVGYSADYVAGVWVGNDDNSPMSRVTGGSIPAQIWHDFMTAALEGSPAAPLPTAIRPIGVDNTRSLELLLSGIEKELP